MTVHLWSTTAANNSTADTSINWAEGQAPSTVNSSARGVMAAIAKYRDDTSGKLLATGAASAYTLTTNQNFTSLTDGLHVSCRMPATNSASATLNVDALGAKTIASEYGTAVAAGVLTSGGVYNFTYDSTDDKWIVHGTQDVGFPSGTIAVFQQTAAPTGWTKESTHNDKALRLVTGTPSTGGTTAFTSVMTDRTILEANMPAHTHGVGSIVTSEAGAHTHTYTRWNQNQNNLLRGAGATDNVARDSSTGTTGSNGAHTHTISGNLNSTGDGEVFSFDIQYVDVILAAKD